jgi:hypothetical protein
MFVFLALEEDLVPIVSKRKGKKREERWCLSMIDLSPKQRLHIPRDVGVGPVEIVASPHCIQMTSS